LSKEKAAAPSTTVVVFFFLSLEISDWYEGGGELVSYIEAYKLLLLSFSGRGKFPLL
jgi:hypothetical protein